MKPRETNTPGSGMALNHPVSLTALVYNLPLQGSNEWLQESTDFTEFYGICGKEAACMQKAWPKRLYFFFILNILEF